jgi:hypothetical protein
MTFSNFIVLRPRKVLHFSSLNWLYIEDSKLHKLTFLYMLVLLYTAEKLLFRTPVLQYLAGKSWSEGICS